jgi:hypothetical protein
MAMADKTPTLDELIEYAKQLSPREKLRLVQEVLPGAEASPPAAGASALQSLAGSLSDLGPAPSAEDIDAVRREMFEDFPRSDIA